MNANPYAPPVAELHCTETPRATFFVVGTSKFALMIVFTFGLYLTYWMYKNWKLYRNALAGMGLIWLPDLHISFALSLLVLLLQVCSLLRVQEAINYLENDVRGTANSTLTFANGVGFAFGLCFWGVAILGFYTLL
jgi:hypothetical protein